MAIKKKCEKISRGIEEDQQHVLRLYVAGTAPRPIAAMENTKKICGNIYRTDMNFTPLIFVSSPLLPKEIK